MSADEQPDVEQPDVEHPVDAAHVDPAELAASLAHDEWCNAMRRAGWRYGDRLDLPLLTHPELVPFDRLGPGARQRYLAQVDDQ